MANIRQQVESVLQAYNDPYLNQSWFELNAVKEINISEKNVTVDIELRYPMAGIKNGVVELLENALLDIPEVAKANVNVCWKITAHRAQKNLQSLPEVKNIIAVASGKGGVGKSTVAVNLALALALEGAHVGIVDGDIYGPSLGIMLGIPESTRPDVLEEKYFVPVNVHGLQAMSMAVLVTEKTPMVWRGPMVSGALLQLIEKTKWQNLDYLIVDMPPGTGDIHLTLAQKIPIAGAVIVTTPQNIALQDAKKGIEMFKKVDIPVLGVVENMHEYHCPECGHVSTLFGQEGGEKIVQDYKTQLLGSLPLASSIREHADLGAPTVISEQTSLIALRFRDIARRTAAQLSLSPKNFANVMPKVSLE